MEAIIESLNQLSSSIVDQINSCDVELLEAYMDQRNLLFDELKACSWSPEQVEAVRPQIENIRQLDKVIIGRMTQLLEEADHELKKFNKAKLSKVAYESGGYGEDSLFFDTKR